MFSVRLLLLGAIATKAAITPLVVDNPVDLSEDSLTIQTVLNDHFPSNAESAQKTIYETVTTDPRFSRLSKAIDFVGDIASLLNDSSAKITFFAPPDKVLRHPHRHWHAHLSEPDYVAKFIFDEFSVSKPRSYALTEVLPLLDDLYMTSLDNPERDRRKRILKLIIRAILEYHIIPTGSYDVSTLGQNTTYPSNLTMPFAFGAKPLRLKVEQSILITTINLFARVIRPDIHASNGVVHVVNQPLIPPPPMFQRLFMAPHSFSIFTSALQRTGLTADLDLRYVHGTGGSPGHLEGSSAATVFAVPNRAFEALPKRLQLFLFSPFGTRVLRKLLQYHIVPDVIVFTDYIYNRTAETVPDSFKASSLIVDVIPDLQLKGSERRLDFASSFGDTLPHPELISSYNLTLQTHLKNHTLLWEAQKIRVTFPVPGAHKKVRKYFTNVVVNGHRVLVPDIVGLNGGVHIIGRLFDPRQGHKDIHLPDDHSWDNWEEWLPQWGWQD